MEKVLNIERYGLYELCKTRGESIKRACGNQ